MSLFTVESDESPIPGAAGRKAVSHDPAVVALLNDTLKPRGIPTPDGKAVTISTPTRSAADAVVSGLRALRDEDKGETKYSPRAKVTPKNKEDKDGPQTVTLWLDNPITRQRKPKDDAKTEASVDVTVTDGSDLTPAEIAPEAPVETETPAVEFSENTEDSHEHGKGRRRFGI